MIHIKKYTYTEENFNDMEWHDSKIYALSFNNEKFEILFDIDYVFEWSEYLDKSFMFLIAPATLVFRNVYDINFESYILDLTIVKIYKEQPVTPKNVNYIKDKLEYNWIIETTSGEISFKSTGFTQFIRQEARLISQQVIGMQDRGGICFEKTTP